MKTFGLAVFIAAVLIHPALAADTVTTTMPVTDQPIITQMVGEGAVQLAPGRYPSFYSFTSDNPTCGNYLAAQYADTDSDGIADTGLSNAPIWMRSKYTPTRGPAGSNLGWQTVLTKTVDIPERFRKSANVLVTWTVRVEAAPGGAYVVKNALCTPWNGTSYQSFSGGPVKTHLFVNGAAKGQDISMTVPSLGASSVSITERDPPPPPPVFWSCDPTITGSYLIRPSDFASGEFPATLTLDVKWTNETNMIINTPTRMRNIVVTVMPVGQG